MFKINKFFNKKGFTLIELIIVLAIITIISSIGIASFVGSSRSATLQTAQDKVELMLNVAKSRALSQTFPSNLVNCGSLKGYKVFFESEKTICLIAVCNNYPENVGCLNSIEAYTLPEELTFSNNPLPDPFYFPILVNTVKGLNNEDLSEPTEIIIKGYEKEKIIIVNPSGVIGTKITPTPSS